MGSVLAAIGVEVLAGLAVAGITAVAGYAIKDLWSWYVQNKLTEELGGRYENYKSNAITNMSDGINDFDGSIVQTNALIDERLVGRTHDSAVTALNAVKEDSPVMAEGVNSIKLV